MRGNANRMAALLRQRRVVDHQHRVVATDQPVRLHEQFGLQRCGIPHAGSNEMMQLVIVTRHQPLRHRLNALAIARTDQARNIEWTHSPPRLVPQASEKRLKPALKLGSPIHLVHRGRPPTKPTPHESPKRRFGNPKSDAVSHNLPK